jgi:ubiquinone/menaquinone biosynthesis C-methylase UbiE
MSNDCFDVKKASKLDSEGRINELRPHDLLKDVGGIGGGMVCVDFGSGTGTFSLPMAQLVGTEGKVYAIDKSNDMLEHIRAKKPPTNLILVERDAEQTGLDSQIADFCLMAFILHEVKAPDYVITEASRLLKPAGKVMVVEWKPRLDSPGPPRNRRISKEQIERLFHQAGLPFIEYIEWSQNHYVAIGNKVKPT